MTISESVGERGAASHDIVVRRVVSHDMVVRGGSAYLLEHGTLDMADLANTLAVSRATLYRVVGSRDRLLGDVLWRLGGRTLDAARRARTYRGVDGIIEVTRRFADSMLTAEAFHRFVIDEPDTAARVLFTPAGRVHERFVVAQKEIFLEAGLDGWSPTELDHLAYLYIRMVESTLHAELLNGRRPDFDLAERVLRALLRRG